MSSTATARRCPGFWDTLTIAGFLALLWLPTADVLFHLDHADPPSENRLPANWPAFPGLGRSREFIAGVERYFDDHFGFRRRLVMLNNHWKGQLFHDSGSPVVLIGRDGWLFFSGARMIGHYTGQDAWSQVDLENWRRLLEGRRDWLRARGAQYLLVLPPDKQRVYPDRLPEWLERGDRPSKVQQLVDYLKSRSTVPILDLRHALVEARKTRATYLKTDTHWNLFGGFAAYRAIAEALAKQVPGLKPIAPDTFRWQPGPPVVGDLARMLGRPEAYPETESVAYVAVKAFTPCLARHDPVRFPYSGASEMQPSYTLNPDAAGKAMVFHDSFSARLSPFLGQHFREVIYVWQYNWNEAWIEREKPDVVIDEVLERFFNEQNPVELARQDQLSAHPPPRAASADPRPN
jgi:alginate O-acetyltransferase complex protein AlgJ